MGTTAKDPLNSNTVSGIEPSIGENGYVHYYLDNQSLTLTPENHSDDLLNIGVADIFFNEVDLLTYTVSLKRDGHTSANIKYDDLDDRIIDLLRSY